MITTLLRVVVLAGVCTAVVGAQTTRRMKPHAEPVVFAAAGGLLMWGSSFADDYVHDELASQNVFFPEAAELREEGRHGLRRL